MKKILVIDDAATVRMYHRSILEHAGYQVEEAINGVEGLEKSLLFPFDLFIVDVNMPKLDGYGFVREYRKIEAIQTIPSLIVSTESEPIDETIAFEAGANAYLIKPVKPEALVANVKLMLGDY